MRQLSLFETPKPPAKVKVGPREYWMSLSVHERINIKQMMLIGEIIKWRLIDLRHTSNWSDGLPGFLQRYRRDMWTRRYGLLRIEWRNRVGDDKFFNHINRQWAARKKRDENRKRIRAW
jgi:hypothetical protein